MTATKTPPPSTAATTQRSSGYRLLLLVVVVLNAIGVVMVLSASHVQALRQYGSSWVFFKKEILWVAIAALAMVGAMRVDYRAWRRFVVPLLVLAAGLMVFVLIPGVGVSVNGSSRWVRAGPLSVQPSEIAKLALVVFIAALLARRADDMADTRLTLRPVLVVLGVMVVLVMRQPDMGTTLVLCTIAFGMLFAAGTPLKPLAGWLGAGVVLAYLAARLEPYRWARMSSFRDPFADAGNTGYQLAQSLIALSSGGLFGVGLGASRAKWAYLPNAHTDFIFSVIGEELGLLGAVLVVVLFLAFAVLGVRTAARAPDRFGMLLAAGITTWVIGQALLNIGVVTGLLPVTGVPLPFVSFGGSSLVVTMAATGILLNITKAARA